MNPSGYGISEEDVQWGWTEIQQFAPEMKRWLNNFPHKQYRRCRFMLLEPDGHITHNDQNNTGRRNIKSAINLAITQPEGCYLRSCNRYERRITF